MTLTAKVGDLIKWTSRKQYIIGIVIAIDMEIFRGIFSYKKNNFLVKIIKQNAHCSTICNFHGPYSSCNIIILSNKGENK